MKKAQRPSVEKIGRAAQGEPSGGFNTTVYQYIEGDGNRPSKEVEEKLDELLELLNKPHGLETLG